MKGTAIKILKTIEKRGEITLEDVAYILPKRFGDHRDFYDFASLVSIGYIDDDKLKGDNNGDPNQYKEQLLAMRYFACSSADRSASYNNLSWIQTGGPGGLKDEKFCLTGRGSLFLSEYRGRKVERIFSIASGIIVGIIVALISSYATYKINTP